MFFKKRKTKEQDVAPATTECKHKYRDYPWYMESYYDDYYRKVIVKIIEPYVCIFCGHRENKELQRMEKYISRKDMSVFLENVKTHYSDRLKDIAVVEDMIADDQLVDRTYLDIWQKIHSNGASQ